MTPPVLGLTRVAFACQSLDDISRRQAQHLTHEDPTGPYVRLTSRRIPRRDLAGGSLFWILKHTLIARQAILSVGEVPGPEGQIAAIRLSPAIIPVVPQHYRAHQGWRYLAQVNWPADAGAGEPLPPDLAAELAGLSLI